jgi:hypothetical protein
MVNIEEIKQVLRSMPKDVILSPYGNELGQGSISRISKDLYQDVDKMAELFDLERITKAVKQISYLFKPARTYSKWTSYGGKHDLERDEKCGEYIKNGDFIIAMILCGYEYKFSKRVNCTFKAADMIS